MRQLQSFYSPCLQWHHVILTEMHPCLQRVICGQLAMDTHNKSGHCLVGFVLRLILPSSAYPVFNSNRRLCQPSPDLPSSSLVRLSRYRYWCHGPCLDVYRHGCPYGSGLGITSVYCQAAEQRDVAVHTAGAREPKPNLVRSRSHGQVSRSIFCQLSCLMPPTQICIFLHWPPAIYLRTGFRYSSARLH